ncbi:MAG: hypothetical protein PHQ35_08395 [Phycisphaerae bacterium]|nr:hypothetical protein [Phycisphaerae bacterium]MDD5381508.1 hypothetical protein [Phycisphaerae bacterium]
MKKLVFLLVFLFPAAIALANPRANPFPMDWLKSTIFYGSCFGVEVLLVATILFFCHMSIVPLLITLFIGNLLIYFFIFQPVLEATENVLVSEAVIVFVDGVFIKILSLFDAFQLDDFKGLKWITAFIIAAAGNLLSYYSGIVIGG